MSFISNLSWRFATQNFNGVQVSSENVAHILDAIRLSPSSFGLQPFHVSVISNTELREQLKTKAWDQLQFTTGSHVLVFSVRTDIDNRIDGYFTALTGEDEMARESMATYKASMKRTFAKMQPEELKSWVTAQTYLALGFALAACAELEIDSCPIEGFDAKAFQEILNLPDVQTPVVALAIGYRDPEDHVRAKTRFPADDLFTLI